MLIISYAGSLGLSPAISSQFSVKMCALRCIQKLRKKLLITHFGEFEVV